MIVRALRVSFALSAIGCAAACGSFLSSSDDVEPAPDAGADVLVPDASTSDTATATEDGGDATASCTKTTPKFAEDFASGGITQWAYVPSQCIEEEHRVVSRDAGDNAYAIRCLAKATDSFAVLQSPATLQLGGETTHVTLSVKLTSTDPHTFAQLLGLYGGDGLNLAFVTTPTEIQISKVVGNETLTSWPAGDSTQWRTVALTITPKKPGESAIYIGEATLDGERRTFEIVRDESAGKASFGVQIGVFANLGAGHFDDAYDDVRIWSCP